MRGFREIFLDCFNIRRFDDRFVLRWRTDRYWFDGRFRGGLPARRVALWLSGHAWTRLDSSGRSGIAPLTVAGSRPASALPFLGTSLGRRLLRLQNSCPVELDVWIVFLDEANRVFVQRRTADANTGRRPEPVENT